MAVARADGRGVRDSRRERLAAASARSRSMDDSFQPEDASAQTRGERRLELGRSRTRTSTTCVQDRRLFRSGSPTQVDDDFALELSAGTFPYHCVDHGGPGRSGMSGVLRIAPEGEAFRRRGPITSFQVTWASETTNTGDRFDVDYRVRNGKWEPWKREHVEVLRGLRPQRQPVDMNPHQTYCFRVRVEGQRQPAASQERLVAEAPVT